jgi:Malectin domain
MNLRIVLVLALCICAAGGMLGAPAFGQVSISPSTAPVLPQGGTVQFTANVPVTWSCPGCAGSIDPSTGVYTAPAVVNSQQSYGGCQLLPNDHIYNTRIDSLPVNSNSAAWIAGAGTVPLNYQPAWNVNYVDGSTPVQNMSFYYTPANNGAFYIPQYPKARIQSGWFTYLTNANPSAGRSYDRHFFMINPANCTLQELYDYYTPGYNAACPTCTSQSGVKYSAYDYALPAHGATDAAGMYLMPQTLRIQELEHAIATGSTINHALRFTLSNGYICSSSTANACGGNAQGTRHIWPATAEALAGGGIIPYGARFRLKASYNISGFSPGAQILLTQLKQYGIILGDGGYNWQVGTEDTYRSDQFASWPVVGSIFREIYMANIPPTAFEAVDESSLMVSPSSGATTRSETVVATSTTGAIAKRVVELVGVTLNLPKDAMYIQAGAAAQQLVAYVNGSSNQGVTWTMNPMVGTLTSGGAYTPPPAVSSTVVATVTATSQANPNVSATMQLSVFPNGPIRIVLGSKTPYTDSKGNVWQPRTAIGGGGDNANYGQVALPGTWSGTDIQLYKGILSSYSDLTFDFVVPNGTYEVTEKYAEGGGTGAGQRVMNLEAQGVTQQSNVDIAALVGANAPKDFTFNVTVTNNELQLVNRFISGYGPMMSALQIVPLSITGSTPAVAPPPSVSVIQVK